MVTKETIGRSLVDGVEAGENRKAVFSVLEKYKGAIPQNVWLASKEKIDNAFREFDAPGEALRGTATSAFFIHTRRHKENSKSTDEIFRQLDDSTRLLPILDPKYQIAEEDVERLWNSLPALKIGEVKGVLGGKEINCALISIPITPQGIEDCNSASERARYVRPRISQGAQLAVKMGAKVIGLGETLASLTMHGRKLKEEFEDIKITTGHAFTTHFMNEWTKFAAEKAGINLSDSQITIIGANGSIGSAMTEMLLKQEVGGLNLHDKVDMVGTLQRKSKQWGIEGKIKITGGNEGLREACRDSRIVLIAASAPRPFMESKHLNPGTFVINDSQPPSITREEAQKSNSVTLWVVGSLPREIKNTFDSGLISAEWTCLLEVLALEALGPDALETVGPVTPDRVRKASEIARQLGIGLAAPQSWGVLEKILPQNNLSSASFV